MTDQQRPEKFPPEPDKGKVMESSAAVPAAILPPNNVADVPAAGEPATSKELTAEEQMALYEKDLKENDWGHQPC